MRLFRFSPCNYFRDKTNRLIWFSFKIYFPHISFQDLIFPFQKNRPQPPFGSFQNTWNKKAGSCKLKII